MQENRLKDIANEMRVANRRLVELRRERNALVMNLFEGGMPVTEVAGLAGMHESRVRQVIYGNV